MLAVFAPLKRDRLCLFGFKNKRWILYSYKIPTVRKKETLISDPSASNLEALEKLKNKINMTLISITLLKAQLSDQEQLGMNRARKAINIF